MPGDLIDLATTGELIEMGKVFRHWLAENGKVYGFAKGKGGPTVEQL